MRNFEILAPVGASEQLKAAVISGANAVYLGADNFNARRNADNFDSLNLKNAVRYCHLRRVKVYVTLNTVVFDKELEELYKTALEIAESGADGVIVQDFASVKAIKDVCPQMPLHASTQMAVHNASGALLLESLGFTRIVLARELSLTEIKKIRESVKAELEVFVHGAHCMAASGNCYLSAILGERSGNRGLCAQGCRLNWKSQHGREYALSLKDMSYLESIKDLMDIGVESFKIEGRMKRPEYVAASVSSLKKAMENEPYNKDMLRSVFSRSGFTDGYLKGKRDLSMFGYRVKEDVTSAGSVFKELQALYKDDIHPLKLDLDLTLKKGEEAILELKSEGKKVTVKGSIPEEPRTAPLAEEIALRNLSKLGDTPFYLGDFSFSNADNLTLRASEINALRREGTSILEEEIAKVSYKIVDTPAPSFSKYFPMQRAKCRIRLQSFDQFSESFRDAEFIIIPIDEILKNKDKAKKIASSLIAELPELIYPQGEELIIKKLKEIKALGISHGATGNIGGIKLLLDEGFMIHGAHGLNITNTISLEKYKALGLKDATLSFELTEKAIKYLGGSIQRGAYVYGYLPLMLMRSCPQKNYSGCDNCSGKTFLTDRRGINFPVLCHNKEFSVLHNSVPLYIGDKNLSYLDFATLYFTIEGKEECENIYNAFMNKENISGNKTNGLFFRELL